MWKGHEQRCMRCAGFGDIPEGPYGHMTCPVCHGSGRLPERVCFRFLRDSGLLLQRSFTGAYMLSANGLDSTDCQCAACREAALGGQHRGERP